MDNKLNDIIANIRSKEDSFRLFLYDHLDGSILDFIDELRRYTSVYLFSGIIRDYFVNPNNNTIRDVDLVYDMEFNIEEFLKIYTFKKNSFGGYKIYIGNYIIDIWNLNETWGLKKGQLSFEFNNLYKLPDTTFFNFSSIIYSLQEYKFIIGKPFVNFLKKNEIDIVLEENPYPELCIINTIYYQRKLNYKLSKKIRYYICNNEKNLSISNLLEIQQKHFDKIIFSENDIYSFLNKVKKQSKNSLK